MFFIAGKNKRLEARNELLKSYDNYNSEKRRRLFEFFCINYEEDLRYKEVYKFLFINSMIIICYLLAYYNIDSLVQLLGI